LEGIRSRGEDGKKERWTRGGGYLMSPGQTRFFAHGVS
jgi:hypothetical protein